MFPTNLIYFFILERKFVRSDANGGRGPDVPLVKTEKAGKPVTKIESRCDYQLATSGKEEGPKGPH